MNRCIFARKGLSTWPAALAALLISVGTPTLPSASAQEMGRQFPQAALRGVLEVVAPPQILINGQSERLSPGARIKGPNNLLVLSASLVGQQLTVNYLRDHQGLVHEVWLLSPLEAAQKRAGMETRTNIVFGSEADKPKTDDGRTPFDQLPKFPRQ